MSEQDGPFSPPDPTTVDPETGKPIEGKPTPEDSPDKTGTMSTPTEPEAKR